MLQHSAAGRGPSSEESGGDIEAGAHLDPGAGKAMQFIIGGDFMFSVTLTSDSYIVYLNGYL